MEFSEWYEAVCQLAANDWLYQGHVHLPEYWRGYYEDGMTPQEAVNWNIEPDWGLDD